MIITHEALISQPKGGREQVFYRLFHAATAPTMNRYRQADLVDERNRALLAEVRSRAGLILVDADCWGVECRAGRVNIACGPSPYPVASFTHQLLQAQYEFLGLQRPDCRLRDTKGPEDFAALAQTAASFIRTAHNQLLHHRFFPEFIALGFPPHEFLTPDESGLTRAHHYLTDLERRRQEFADGAVPVPYWLEMYLMLWEPHDQGGERRRLQDLVRQIAGPHFAPVAALLTQWVEELQPDVCWYIARLFHLVGLHNVAVGYQVEEMIWASACTSNVPKQG